MLRVMKAMIEARRGGGATFEDQNFFGKEMRHLGGKSWCPAEFIEKNFVGAVAAGCVTGVDDSDRADGCQLGWV